MKKVFSYLVLAGSCFSLMACGQTTKNSSVTNTSETNRKEIKVNYYDTDGKTLLKNEKVNSIKDILKFKPEKQGKNFEGWYVKPDYSRKFTDKMEVKSVLSLYAGFSTYKADKREFIILGKGKSPTLKTSNWGAVVNDTHKMKKEEQANSNIYKISVDLEAGDEFQFAINNKWENQRGFGYLQTTKKDGVSYFENSGGIGEVSSKRANIKVVKPGTYTFTLVTHPAEDTYDTKNEKYTELKKEAFNMNPFDTIFWDYTKK